MNDEFDKAIKALLHKIENDDRLDSDSRARLSQAALNLTQAKEINQVIAKGR